MYLKHRPQLQIITTLVTVLFANHSHELLPSLCCHLPLWDIYMFTMVCFIILLFGCWSVSGLLWVFFIFESMNWCNNYLFLKFERIKNHFFLRNTREVIVPSERINFNLQAGHILEFLKYRVKDIEPFDYIEHVHCWYRGKCKYVMLCKAEKFCLIF